MHDESEQLQPERYAVPFAPAPRLRAFQHDFKRRVLVRIAGSFGLASVEELPAYFQQELVWPAKIGLATDLSDRFGAARDRDTYTERRKALNPYFRSFQYHQAILQCDLRFDLDLNSASDVMPADRAYSMKALFDMKQRKLQQKLSSGQIDISH